MKRAIKISSWIMVGLSALALWGSVLNASPSEFFVWLVIAGYVALVLVYAHQDRP